MEPWPPCPFYPNAEEQDCAAQVATEDLNETADDAKKPIMAGIAEETTELCDDIASKPVMEKAEARYLGRPHLLQL